jgi:hypothetical protein
MTKTVCSCKNLLLTLGQVDEQDRTRRAGQDKTSRTGRDEQDRQDDDLDLDLVTPFELETNQSGSGFI